MAVLWFHLTNGNPALPGPGFLRDSGRYGFTGVQMFFVISGYVLPYALEKRAYHIRDFGTFMARRIVRLEPPYIVSLVLAITLAFASTLLPDYAGQPFHFDLRSLLLHLTYTVNIAHGHWWNPVYWTLAIELQFYLLIALVFPLLRTDRVFAPFAVTAVALGAALLLPSESFIFRWLPVFAAGAITYRMHAGMVDRKRYFASIAVITIGSVFLYGGVIAGVVAGSTLLVAFAHIHAKPLLWLGALSYSLYLLHVPLGGRVINFALRLKPELPGVLLAMVGSFVVSLAGAWLLHRYVEEPSRRAAARIVSTSAPR